MSRSEHDAVAQTPTGVFRRPVTPTEWWFLGHPDALSPTLGIVVEGHGTIDHARLTEAVARAGEACPGSRLVCEEESREWVDGGVPPEVLVVRGAGDLANLPELQAPLSGANVPFCQVVLIRGETTAVAFRAHHAVMDAQGVVLWASDVFRALRGEQCLGAPDPISDQDVYKKVTGFEPVGIPVSDKAPIMGSCEPTDRSRSVSARRTLQGIHPGLVARLAVLLTDLVPEERRAAFYVPVDLRHSVPGVRSTAGLALGLTMETTPGEDWEAVHERLLRSVKDGEHLRNIPAREVLDVPRDKLSEAIAEIDEASRGQERFTTDAVISHVGRIEPDRLNAPGFTARTAFLLGRPAPTAAPELDVLEVGRHTEITMSWWDGEVTAERIEALMDRVEEELSPAAHRAWAGNDTAVEHPDRTDVVRRFLRSVDARPDAIALDGPDEKLTYRQMERRTAVLAAALRERGVGPETVVGVLGDRSVASLVAVWAVLRSGGAYLPIDARNPNARIAEVLSDAGAPICLSQRPHHERECFPEGCTPLAVEDFGTGPDPAAPDLGDPEIPDDRLACVIYTSGSTGRPKGAEIEHGSVRSFTDWAIERFGVDADTRMPLLTSLGFDFASNSIYLPLLVGGTVVLRPAEIGPMMLRELLTESGANTLHLTPSHLTLIGRLGVRPKGFRSLVLGGERLSTSAAREAREIFGPQCAIINGYGPTETTIMATTHLFDPVSDTGPAVPIGRPSENCAVHLLDRNGRFVAEGESGEVFISGVQVARGYRGRPELTAERFVRLADGTRVYRTGDLARVDPGGRLTFEDRIDDQVKIAGNRVEPAEITRALRSHPAVADAVATARPSGKHKALAVYVVRSAEVTVEALMRHLAAQLPPYMLPAAIVFVDMIPHSLNGKADLRLLPDPFRHETQLVDVAAAAGRPDGRDPLAAAVAAVWAEVLDRAPEQISDGADFHELGGNSLELLSILTSVSTRIVGEGRRDRFDAMLGRLVREPTLAHLIDCTRLAMDPSTDSPSVPSPDHKSAQPADLAGAAPDMAS